MARISSKTKSAVTGGVVAAGAKLATDPIIASVYSKAIPTVFQLNAPDGEYFWGIGISDVIILTVGGLGYYATKKEKTKNFFLGFLLSGLVIKATELMGGIYGYLQRQIGWYNAPIVALEEVANAQTTQAAASIQPTITKTVTKIAHSEPILFI